MNHALTTTMAAAVLLASAAANAADPATSQPARPSVEVVFVLDTTGSMSGLIKAAKEKIWAIANTLASAKPAPDIKMGLVGYRDRRDAYVTKLTALTPDIDAVYRDLMTFSAQGGGDTPESVNQALHEAVTKMAWSTDDDTYRVIFLVGDCPPHMDYPDDVKYPTTCKLAARKGIIVNTIQCGKHAATTPIWTDIATRAEGSCFRVEQSGGSILASTPFDKELADLSSQLDETRVYYGSVKARAKGKKRSAGSRLIVRKASPSAAAQRAAFNAADAGKFNWLGEQELVDAVASKRVDLDTLKPAALPTTMRTMSVDERKVFVANNLAKRKTLQARIRDLNDKRQSHIKQQIEQAGLKGKQSFDRAVVNAVKAQAVKKGIAIQSESSH